jgi:hypothetical protein
MNKASLLVSDKITVQVKQDGKVVGSTSIDASILSTTYRTITATFAHPVNVTADKYDIEVSYDGKGLVSVQQRQDYRPGNSFTGSTELLAYDLVSTIQSETTTSTAGNVDTGTGSSSDSNTPSDGTTVKLRVNAVDQNGKPVSGMWIAILQGFTMLDHGFSESTFTLKKNVAYTVYMDSYTGSQTTWTFKGWQDSSAGTFRDAKLTSDETFTAKYQVSGSTTTGGTTGGTTGSTGGTTGSTGSDTGGTTTAGANQVAVNSQKLDGSTITGMAVELREASTGTIAQNSFTPALLTMKPGIEYKAIMYPFGDTYFRHWTDGALHRYHLVDTAHNSGKTLVAQYEKVSSSQAAHLVIIAKTSDGQTIGGTTGTEEDLTLNAQPGLEVLVAPPNTLTPYTAGFTGGSEIANGFYFLKGQTYTVVIEEFGKYKFSHWQNDGGTNRARAVPLNGDTTLTAIFDVIS